MRPSAIFSFELPKDLKRGTRGEKVRKDRELEKRVEDKD